MMDPLYLIKVKCVCCETVFQTSRVRPSFKKSVRVDSDFCCYFNGINPDFYVVRVCPACGYATTENFRDKIFEKQRAAYYEKLGKIWTHRDYGNERTAAEAMDCYKLALLTAQAVGEKERVIAALLHHIAWLYRYDGRKEQEDRFLKFALDSYIKVFETETESISNARLMFLIGDLNKRLGDFNAAVRWFGRIIHDKKIMDAGMIRASREQWQNIRDIMTGRGEELPEEMRQSGS